MTEEINKLEAKPKCNIKNKKILYYNFTKSQEKLT